MAGKAHLFVCRCEVLLTGHCECLITPLATDFKNRFNQRFLRPFLRNMVFVSDLIVKKINLVSQIENES